MKKMIFAQLPEMYKSEFDDNLKLSNYKRLLILGITFFVIQIIALVDNIVDPFSDNMAIMSRYYKFYIVALVLNVIITFILIISHKKHKVDKKYFTLLLVIYMYTLHFWAMGVAIADQFQGEDIVVYYLSMFFIAILVNISVYELGTLLISFHILLYSLSPYISKYSDGDTSYILVGVQFIVFSLMIRYILRELNIKNYLQTKKLREINNKLEYLSYYDSLSNLYNRRKWEEHYNEMYLRCFDNSKSISVVILDIDYFKQYNDSYGHVKGDDIIRVVSDSLIKVYSESSNNIGRYGGDEYVVSIEDISENENYKLIKELKAHIASLNIENKESETSNILSVSVGSFYGVPESIDGQWDFVAKADKNLYFQKEDR